MGAWDYAVYDDDTAYDVLEDLRASADIITEMEKYFDEVIESEYVEYDEGHYALVSATVMDSVINGTPHRCDDDDYLKWIKALSNIDFSSLKEKAVKAIDMVLSSNSELKELWEENEELYTSWREDKLAIQKRLFSK